MGEQGQGPYFLSLHKLVYCRGAGMVRGEGLAALPPSLVPTGPGRGEGAHAPTCGCSPCAGPGSWGRVLKLRSRLQCPIR